MRSKKKGIKKFLAEFLCVALIACSIPGAAFAAEEENTGKGSVTSTYEANDGAAEGQKNVAGTGVKDTSDTGGQNTGEGDVKDPDGKTGTGGEVSEGADGDSGTPGSETKESDSEEADTKEKSGDGEEAGDTAQGPAEDDDESESESTEDSVDEDDAEDDAGSQDDTDMDSDDAEADTEDDADAEDEDEDEPDVTDTAKGGSATSDDEEEEDEDEEEEDWIDGPLDDDLMLLTATPSDAMPVAEMGGEYYDTVQDAIDEAETRSTITMVDDCTENIIISDGLILTLDLAGFSLEGEGEGSVVTIIDAELTLEDSSGDEGRITGGNSDYGGGVYISDGTFRMTGGTISDNTANIYGGGVYLDSGTFTMTGGIIYENIADTAGSDIYAEEGSVAILEASDMMDGDYKWYVDNEESRYSEDNPASVCDDEGVVGASTSTMVRKFAVVLSGDEQEDGDVASLTTDDGTSYTYYSTVQEAVTAAGSTEGTVTMLADSKEDVNIASGQTIILDLDGYTLTGLGDASVILNYGTLTLEDSSGDDSGKITGGTGSSTNGSASGGGINNHGNLTMNGGTITENNATGGGGVADYGTFTMNNGIICKNTVTAYGGGVLANGTFMMNGGIISENTASNGGGGIYPAFTMNDGTICNNNAKDGGGIYIYKTTNLYGGTITGNSATNAGGGVYNYYSSFNMQGGAIYGNTAKNNAADIYSYSNSSLAIIDAVRMLGNEDPEQCYKWYKDTGNRYSPENITAVYDDENVINAGSPYYSSSAIQIIAAGDEGHIYSEENVTFTWDGTDSCTATFICMDCEHEETVNCDITSETVTEPTCTDKGSAKYTATATISSRGEELTVTDEQTEEIKALGHEWEVEQTILEDSEDRYEEMVGIKCTRCGLEYEEEIVISTESSGVTAHSSLSWSDLLTEDDLADLFESGAELDFKMTAAALSESDVPSVDRTLAEDLIAAQWPDADYTASWLDISVLLDIIHSTGEEEIREYSSTLNPVTITVTIPDELLNADGDTYAVIRIHSGEAEALNTTDNGDGTLTFESDLFSSYVIVKTAESDSGNGGSGSGGSRRHSSNNSYTGSGVSGTGSIAYSTGTWTIDELGHWRYTDSSGRRYENEWGYIYNPYADTSAGQPSASWFHFGYDGIMDIGWFIDTDGKMYYLNPSLDNTQGAMFTGWVFIDGKWYYFDASGALLRNTQTPDGYTVDETGARVEG